ncbi:MAG: hypothetical protein OXH69_07220 [Acidobacteria bacterium]|nr:hypothetical protein [Acidobacteriota bacterium]
MTGDTKWLIGTGVVLAGLLGGLLSAQIQGVNTSLSSRMERLENRMDRLENRFDGLDERLRNVEVALGKVDQRLLTIERVVLPGNEQRGE